MSDIYAEGRVPPVPHLFANEKCACKHPLWWHLPNDLYSRDPEKFSPPWNGICSKRECSCHTFRLKAAGE